MRMAHVPSTHIAAQGRTESKSGANPAAASQGQPNTTPAIAPTTPSPINT